MVTKIKNVVIKSYWTVIWPK